MSNKTQLQTNNATLDSYITRINAVKDIAASLPEAGSGGGSVETCNITLNYVTGSMLGLLSISYTKLGANGCEIVHVEPSTFQNYTTVLENVVCKSLILIGIEEIILSNNEVSSNIIDFGNDYGIKPMNMNIFLPTSPENGTITITNNM